MAKTKGEKKKKPYVLELAVFSGLRRVQRSSPAHHAALNRAKSEFFILSKKGKSMRRVQFTCAMCGNKSSRLGVAVDHREPVVNPHTGFTTYDEYIKRLFCAEDGLQVLCKTPCHSKKSALENAIRRKVKKDKGSA